MLLVGLKLLYALGLPVRIMLFQLVVVKSEE